MFLSVQAGAQGYEQFSITKIDIPGINIRKLEEDEKSFMWIGTQDGLFRFDSKTATEYNTEKNPPYSLNSSDVRVITYDTIGHSLWVSTSEGGICQVDINTGFIVFRLLQSAIPDSNNITAIQNFNDKLFISTTAHLYLLDKQTKSLSPVELPDHFSSAVMENMILYENRLLLFYRSRGLVLYDIPRKIILDSLFLPAINNASDNYFLRFYEIVRTSQGEWLAATSDGVKKITITRAGKINVVKTPFAHVPFTYRNETFGIAKDQTGHIWVSTETNLVKINPSASTFSIVKANAQDKEGDWLDNVYYLYCDKMNNIWMGCQKGLAMLKNEIPAFSSYHKSSNSETFIGHAYYLLPYNDSILYSTAENGLYKVNLVNKEITAIDQTQAFDYIFKDPYGLLIASGRKGLSILNHRSLTPVSRHYPEFSPFENYKINSSIVLNDSCLVMGTESYKGILVWNFRDHRLSNYTETTYPIQLVEGNVNNIFRLSDTSFCVLTDISFVVVDYRNKTTRSLLFKNEQLGRNYKLFFDMCRLKDLYYVASYSFGVLVLDKNLKMVQTISTGSGLSNNGTYKILPWKDSLLFITTNNGLNLFNPITRSIKTFYKSDGLHDNTFEETSGNMYNDIIFAGGPNGFTSLRTSYIVKNNKAPLVYFSRLRWERPDNDRKDTTNLNTTSFSIPNNTLQTTVYFSGINYRNPARTVFAYKIRELHKEWIHLGNQHFINLIGMSPGTYHLQVKAANEDDVWSEPRELVLVFLPKWHQTWWFKLLIAVLFLAAVYGLYRLRLRELKKEQEIRSKIATDLHDDLGGTLNSVKVYTNLALMNKEPEKYLGHIKENIQEAITGVKDIIWVLDNSKDTVEDLLGRVNQFASLLCEANGIKYRQEMTEEARYHKLPRGEKRNLYMIVKEAVNNSCKYSNAKEVIVSISVSKKKTTIDIQDDGQGFDISVPPEGNGLKNMRLRARQIKYAIDISSSSEGTLIRLQKD